MKLQDIPWGYHYSIKTMGKSCHIIFMQTVLSHTDKDELIQYTFMVRPLNEKYNKVAINYLALHSTLKIKTFFSNITSESRIRHQ